MSIWCSFMELRKSFTIAKYLLKEYTINPLLKKHRKIFLGVVIAVVLLVTSLAIAASLLASPQQEKNNTTSTSQSIANDVRSLIRSAGLNKDRIIDIISSILMFYLIAGIVRGGKIVVSGAAYELILSQPISIDTYIMGDTLYKVVLGLMITPFYFSFVPSALALNGNDSKALLIPFSLFIVFFLFGEISGKTTTTISKFLEDQGWARPAKIILITYLVVGTAHSAIIRYPSPLLSTPLRSLSELLVYPFTISETINDIIVSLLKSILIIAVFFTLFLLTAKYITPEDIAPLTEITKKKTIKRIQRKRSTSFRFNPGSIAAREYILRSSIMRMGHVLSIGALITIAAVAAYITRHVILIIYGHVGIESSYITSIFAPLVIIMASNAFINMLLASDMTGYWIYRVYLVRMDSVASSLMLKYLIYLSEALFIISVIDMVLSHNYLFLLFPLIALPSMTVAAFLALAILVYFASKRRIVKYRETNMTILEETASWIIMGLLIASVLVSKTGYTALLSVHPSPIAVLSIALSSTLLSALLFIALSRILAKIMEKYDLIL